MSEPVELAHGVLLRVADFVKKLPPDQLAALANGTARLEVVPKGSRVVGTTGRGGGPAAASKPLPVSAEQVRTELAKIGDRAGARRWLEDQRLTVAQLKRLAGALDISVPSKTRKDDLLDHLVQWTVGRLRDAEAISRPAPPRA